MKLSRLAIAAGALALALATPALAENKVRIIGGYALTLLPNYIVQERELIQKHAARLGLSDVTVEFSRSPSVAVANEGLITNNVDIALYGMGPMLNVWDKTNGAVKGVMAVSDYTQAVYTVDPKINSLDDLGENDRVAMTDIKTSNQALMMQMQAAEKYGWDGRFHFDPNLIAMFNEDSTAALVSGASEIKSAMLTVPYNDIVTRAGARKIWSSDDVLGGRVSAGMLYGNVKFVEANPVLYEAVVAAYEEANEWINANPAEAAVIYVKYEPQKDGAPYIERLIREGNGFSFTTTPKGVKRFADFMHKSGLLSKSVDTWTDVFFDNVATKPGS